MVDILNTYWSPWKSQEGQWHLPPNIRYFRGDVRQLRDNCVALELQTLERVLSQINRTILERTSIPMGNPANPFQSGDSIWLKDWKKTPLLPVGWGFICGAHHPHHCYKVIGVSLRIHHTSQEGLPWGPINVDYLSRSLIPRMIALLWPLWTLISKCTTEAWGIHLQDSATAKYISSLGF